MQMTDVVRDALHVLCTKVLFLSSRFTLFSLLLIVMLSISACNGNAASWPTHSTILLKTMPWWTLLQPPVQTVKLLLLLCRCASRRS